MKSRSQALRTARPHPFATPARELARIHPGADETAILAMPSLLTAPLDSPELVRVRPRPAPTRTPALTCWSVPIIGLDGAAALDMLARSPSADNVRYGASLRFLGEVAAFARNLADRHRVLPKLDHRDDGRFAARWRPVLQGPDVAAFQALVAAMPPICRAEVAGPEDQAGQNPGELVTAALHALADAAVRERLTASESSTLDALPARRGRRPKRTPAAETWFGALSGTDATVEADAGELDTLAGALSAWADFGDGHVGPARATFRLAEVDTVPDADPLDATQADAAESCTADATNRGQWQLEFWLQSIEDPSLLVAAPQIWDGGHGLQRWLERPDELLLTELGRASTVYPALAGAMRQARPEALELDATRAHDFLANYAHLLDLAGFGVLVPSWWSNRRKLGLTATASPTLDGADSAGMLTRDTLCAFEWRLAVGDDPLTEDELAALAATKEPLVRLRGEWIAVDPEQIRRGLDFIQQQAEQTQNKTVPEVISLAATDPDDMDTPLPVNALHADGWLGDLLEGTVERTLEPIEPPEAFQATLRPYQRRGLSWLAFLSGLGLGACLADDMGLGKTIQLLALELHQRATHPAMGPTVILCPMSLVGNWQREAQKFAPALRVYAHHGPGRFHGDELAERLADVDLVITTYHTAVRDIEDLGARTWERVVLDEAQAIKNHQTKLALAARRLSAEHRVALTGTPMENRLTELWSVLDFLNPGLLGSAELFRTRYAKPIEHYGQSAPADRLRAITQPYILRRVKTDTSIVDDLPEKIEIKQYCNLTAEQASLYQSIVAEMLPKIERSEGIERRGNVLAAMTKLKQVCNHPGQLLHDGSQMGRRSGKVSRLYEILEEILDEGDRALLFTQFTEFAEMLLPHLSAHFGRDIIYLHGKTSRKNRDDMVQRFQADGDGPPIFLLSLKAGGTGLNLTEANHVVHLDRWWNPAVENQATDRAFRIGQKRSVQVRKFICTGTLEEKIDQMIEQKKHLADLVVGDGEGWLTDLSTQDLQQLFTLSEGAVGE